MPTNKPIINENNNEIKQFCIECKNYAPNNEYFNCSKCTKFNVY